MFPKILTITKETTHLTHHTYKYGIHALSNGKQKTSYYTSAPLLRTELTAFLVGR